MSFRFFGQKIFDSKNKCVGVELLIRDAPFGQDIIRSPFEIMGHPDFDSHDLYAIDMQLLTYLNLFVHKIKGSGIKYVFINLSDQFLKSLVVGDDSTSPFCNLLSLIRAYSPLKIVVEVNENSRVRKEHLSLIVDRLKSAGVLVAQDDYTVHRSSYLSIDWDFVKLDLDSCLPHEYPQNVPLVIEKSNQSQLQSLAGDVLHQGFDLHYPEDFLELFSGDNFYSPKPHLVASN